MDLQDRPDDRLMGAECGACGGIVAGDGVRVLARRDDLAFVSVACDACGSDSLAILLGSAGDGPTDGGRSHEADAVSVADVLAMRSFLAGYRGDIRALLDRAEPA